MKKLLNYIKNKRSFNHKYIWVGKDIRGSKWFQYNEYLPYKKLYGVKEGIIIKVSLYDPLYKKNKKQIVRINKEGNIY